MADLPDHDTFTRHVGETFRIRPPEGGPVEVELVEAKALASQGGAQAGTRSVPFALLFRVRGSSDLPQSTYRVEHDALGAMDLFLVPIGADAVGMRLEAIFN